MAERNFATVHRCAASSTTDSPVRRSCARADSSCPGHLPDTLPTRLFQNVVYGDPIDSGRLHRDGPYPALLQPGGHRLEFGGGAPELPYRLAVSARRYSRIVGFVADINARSVGMDHF